MSVLTINDEMEELLQHVVKIAVAAGEVIMNIYNAPVHEISEKSDHSPLTQADLAADAVIKNGLLSLGLDWPLLSEESAQIPFANRENWHRYWLIDPLDGTKEFIKRNGEFTVNIALIEDGDPILGVVYAPALDICYFAARDVGSFVKKCRGRERAINVKQNEVTEPLRVVTSRSHGDARTESLIARLGECQRVCMGSSLKLCLVAAGEAHFYPRLGPTMEWDIAAAHAVVRFAGGRVCDAGGRELQYNKPNLLNPEFFVLSGENNNFLSRVSDL